MYLIWWFISARILAHISDSFFQAEQSFGPTSQISVYFWGPVDYFVQSLCESR